MLTNEFGPMLETLTSNDPNIKYELTSAQAHQPESERNNQIM
jgi:hypothetical protein